MILSSYQYDSMFIVEHEFQTPLNYNDPSQANISVFVREIRGTKDSNKPYLIFFQGGPGFESPRPITNSGWIKFALNKYNVLLLDQRGTGLSTPATFQTLHSKSPEEQADYLQFFRADNIVRDAEFIRNQLNGDKPWSILGQSFGGFCALNYLSFHAHGLKEVFITGGIPPLDAHPDDIYRRTYLRVKQKNEQFYATFPNAQQNACAIADLIKSTNPVLPNGDRLTIERFQLLGLQLGFSDGFATLNYLMENAIHHNKLSYGFKKGLMGIQAFDTNPFFTILHEACYTQKFASNWSAHRIQEEFPEFQSSNRAPILFTGEMLFPWMLDQFSALSPLKDATNILANKSDWPILYDVNQLEKNTTPIASAVYTNDMYVDRHYSIETAKQVTGLKVWETDEFEHNGLRSHGKKVLENLFALLD